ncbi:MAG: hypothetical protein QOK49_2896 [Baekduia sp.]|jgi:hypothetical protein|nr:hypothetical protein [Baekduia sp.]
MNDPVAAAAQFLAGHGRLLERRRLEHFLDPGPEAVEAVVTALAACRNADHGIGFLEPDLRTPASQPSAVLYALEVLAEVKAANSPLATGALDWLTTVTNHDGGIPFVLPTAAGWPHAPWWTPVPDPPSSLLMTAGVAGTAYGLDGDHRWLGPATSYVWAHLKDLKLSDPYTLRYVVRFLDAIPDRARADAELDVLRDRMPEDGVLRVEAGVEGEVLSPLEIAPRPDHAGARLVPEELIERHLDALAGEQQDDGGWTFTWQAWNPAAALEWRGMQTLTALNTLRANGRLPDTRREATTGAGA